MKHLKQLLNTYKITLTLLAITVFFAFNYVLAMNINSPWGYPAPVWIFQDSPVKKAYFKQLSWSQRALIVTMAYEGGNIENGKGGIRTEKAQIGSPEFVRENQQRMSEIGTCYFDGKEGYWEFYVTTYTFFNIPVSSGTISCNNGLL